VFISDLAAALFSIWVVLTPLAVAGEWGWTIVSAASSKEKCEEIRERRDDWRWTVCARLGSPPKTSAPSDSQGNDEENG